VKTFTLKAAFIAGKPRKAHSGSKAAKKGKAEIAPRPRPALFGVGGQEAKREWLLIDAKDLVLGRLASKIAIFLRGKHKPTFMPNMDMGDFVVVVNAGAIKLTGSKEDNKLAYWHTGYPGGIKSVSYGELREKDPFRMLTLAVKRMLPRNKLRKHFLRKLKVYAGSEHPHAAQQPRVVAVA
jgi:large subunit ribosomal protein L13